jgi:hypothetical protein
VVAHRPGALTAPAATGVGCHEHFHHPPTRSAPRARPNRRRGPAGAVAAAMGVTRTGTGARHRPCRVPELGHGV